MMDSSFYRRMDWGLGNPNKTAALIVSLMLSLGLLAYVRKWGFWLGLFLVFDLGICLILTLSRGGIVSVLLGASVVLGWAPRPYSFQRALGVIVVCGGLILLACLVNEPSRMVRGLSGNDLSVENRLLIWKQVPAMIHDAPAGWGVGRSGDAYMQWYQPINRGEGYRTLVNSHLTWLVEFNWWGRITYVAAWIAVIIFLWPDSKHRWFSIPVGIWLSLASCAFFSSVAESPWLWVLPLLGLVSVLFVRIKENVWPSRILWISGACLFSVLITPVLAWEWAPPSSSVYSPHPGVVSLGVKSPALWVIAPDVNILGEHYGHEARRGLKNEPLYRQTGLGFATAVKDIPRNKTLIFSGEVPTPPIASDDIILISPQPPNSPIAFQWLTTIPKVTVIVGEYSRNRDYWEEQSKSHPNIKLQVVGGMEDYISRWAHEIVLAVENSNKTNLPVTSN